MTVGEDFPKQQERLRGLIEQYRKTQALCPESNCMFAIAMLENVLKRADQAAISGDTVELLRAYEAMKSCE